MTVVEQRLLADVMRHDDLMRDAVKKGEWDIAASRWNSFVTRCSTERIIHENLRQAMHLVTGDVLRKAVVAINKRAEVESEKKAIALKATLSTLTFDYLSPLQSPFTEYENTVLLLYVKKYSTTSKSRAKDIIRWKELTSAWLVRHQAERESLQVNRLILRAEKVLRSHYQTLSKAVKRVLTSTGDAPALSASEDAGALTIAQSPMHSTSAPASSSSPSALASDAVSTASPLDAPSWILLHNLLPRLSLVSIIFLLIFLLLSGQHLPLYGSINYVLRGDTVGITKNSTKYGLILSWETSAMSDGQLRIG